MPTYTVTDPSTGKVIKITGDSPPTEQELEEIFASYSKKPVDFDLGTMVENIPESGLNLAKDMASAVMHPIDTATAVAQLGQSGINKLAVEGAELVTGRDAPPNMPGYDTQLANAAMGAVRDRYGSIDAVKNTLMTDPVGAAFDATAVGGLSRIPRVANLAAAADPVHAVSKAVKTVGKGAAQAIPDNKLTDWYKRSAKFTTTKNDAERTRMAETAIREGVIPNDKGLITLQDRISDLSSQIDNLIAEATETGTKIPVSAVYQHLKELRQAKGGMKLEAASDLKAIDKVAKTFTQHAKKAGRKDFTPDELQAFKRDIYDKINFDARHLQGTPITVDTRKAIARGAKDAISNAVDGVDGLNRQLGELLDLQPHLERAANRIGNRNPIGLTTPLNVGAGSVAGELLGSGHAGMAAGAVVAALNNPKMAARISVALKKLKDGDIDWLTHNRGRQDVRIALILAARAEDIVSGQEANQ